MTTETKRKLPWRTSRWRNVPARDAETRYSGKSIRS
jgi:hypothetical protein